jgi:hypothetical protein
MVFGWLFGKKKPEEKKPEKKKEKTKEEKKKAESENQWLYEFLI